MDGPGRVLISISMEMDLGRSRNSLSATKVKCPAATQFKSQNYKLCCQSQSAIVFLAVLDFAVAMGQYGTYYSIEPPEPLLQPIPIPIRSDPAFML